MYKWTHVIQGSTVFHRGPIARRFPRKHSETMGFMCTRRVKEVRLGKGGNELRCSCNRGFRWSYRSFGTRKALKSWPNWGKGGQEFVSSFDQPLNGGCHQEQLRGWGHFLERTQLWASRSQHSQQQNCQVLKGNVRSALLCPLQCISKEWKTDSRNSNISILRVKCDLIFFFIITDIESHTLESIF